MGVDLPLFQVDIQALYQDHQYQGFLILHTDILLLHTPIYQFIMAHMEDICLFSIITIMLTMKLTYIQSTMEMIQALMWELL